ncbi:serine-protein kinase RsbW [Rhodobacteraceae bacterium THAF1]|uniref:ATP-binding protein n=1 Tax=Palleronia sp. THAF1 TaxID=2587842 RepID=UPI000F3E150E|nr:ATP-binding protein [Palleronia sp. THAF1]QFU09904.1 serine-protein kinase RsbW [Palleronia sp. THAF1]VDC17193.1 serine-protein kinase RsbW [Rhodobacteraceae bacterium THAF1]
MPVERIAPQITGETLCRPDGRRELRVLYPSDPFAVRAALKTTTDALRGFDVAQDDCDTIELVLAEVLNNVGEHAYPGDASGIVELRVVIATDSVACEVLDNGPSVPTHLLDGRDPPVPSALPEGGFGWHLIHSLCREISYTRLDARNILTLEISLHRKLTLS